MIRTGGCQCGKIRFRATDLVDNSHVCHCRMCQKAVGNFFAALVGVPKPALTWTNGTPAIFESSEGIERGFCRDCGTPLFFHNSAGAHVSICIGAFDNPASLPLVFEFATERRLPQIAQLGRVEQVLMSDQADYIAERERTSRQHPDHD